MLKALSAKQVEDIQHYYQWRGGVRYQDLGCLAAHCGVPAPSVNTESVAVLPLASVLIVLDVALLRAKRRSVHDGDEGKPHIPVVSKGGSIASGSPSIVPEPPQKGPIYRRGRRPPSRGGREETKCSRSEIAKEPTFKFTSPYVSPRCLQRRPRPHLKGRQPPKDRFFPAELLLKRSSGLLTSGLLGQFHKGIHQNLAAEDLCDRLRHPQKHRERHLPRWVPAPALTPPEYFEEAVQRSARFPVSKSYNDPSVTMTVQVYDSPRSTAAKKIIEDEAAAQKKAEEAS